MHGVISPFLCAFIYIYISSCMLFILTFLYFISITNIFLVSYYYCITFLCAFIYIIKSLLACFLFNFTSINDFSLISYYFCITFLFQVTVCA